ncbi:MAG: magnesium/cobalt efflux protein, partial [Pseudomonadota bacterium]|nr:magnesium/cobalt efflux protein [Pseudomonadota bacterium]
IETVGGLVATLAGRVPQRGEVVAHPRGYEFEVIDADPRRIKRVRVRRVTRAVQDVADTAA